MLNQIFDIDIVSINEVNFMNNLSDLFRWKKDNWSVCSLILIDVLVKLCKVQPKCGASSNGLIDKLPRIN